MLLEGEKTFFKILHHESFFSCKSFFSLSLYKGNVNRGKRRQNLTFCDPSINGSVHNSIYVCVGASMWKHRGLRDIKPFPLNIIWPYQSHSQKKAYVCICWKNAPSHCAAESLHILLFILCGNAARKWHLYGIWESDKWAEGSKKKKKGVFWGGNKPNFWKNANAHLSINMHRGFCIKTYRGQFGHVFMIHSCNPWI